MDLHSFEHFESVASLFSPNATKQASSNSCMVSLLNTPMLKRACAEVCIAASASLRYDKFIVTSGTFRVGVNLGF